MKRAATLLILIALLVWSAHGIGFRFQVFGDIGNTVKFIRQQWFPLDFTDWRIAFSQLIITLQIALFSTLVAILFALPLSFFAARNWSPWNWLYHGTRSFFNLLRSIPEIVLALVFIPTLGLGPLPAVMALIIHNVGVFGKTLSETMEAMDEGPQEAVQAVGGTRGLVAVYGILPQMVPLLLSQYFYRLEVAIRACLILGLVGAGGIGQLLYNDFKQFMYPKVAVEVLCIMLLVVAVDYIGAAVRKRVT